jgi:hypothetical protein
MGDPLSCIDCVKLSERVRVTHVTHVVAFQVKRAATPFLGPAKRGLQRKVECEMIGNVSA